MIGQYLDRFFAIDMSKWTHHSMPFSQICGGLAYFLHAMPPSRMDSHYAALFPLHMYEGILLGRHRVSKYCLVEKKGGIQWLNTPA